MVLSKQEIESLVHAISLTKPNELTCDDCLKELAQFAEQSLQGKSIPEGREAIEHHLAICSECKEEYQALLTALNDSA